MYEITQYVKENQVTIVNSNSYGKIPIHLARDYKVIVATSEAFIYQKYERASKEIDKEVFYLTSEISHFRKQYRIAFIAYGSNVLIQEIWNNRNRADVVLIIDDSFNCVNADLLMSFVKHLISEGAQIKLVIINKVAKYSQKLSNFFNAPVVDFMPDTYSVHYELHPAEALEDVVVHFSTHILYTNILVLLPGEWQIKNLREYLVNHFQSSKRPLIYTVSSGSRFNYKSLKSLHRKIVIATGNIETIMSLIDSKFDIVIDSGLEKKWKVINGIETLTTRNISQNGIEQRKALASRSYHLCSDFDYKESRKEVSDVLERSFDKMLLGLISLGIDINSLPLLFCKSRYVVNTCLHMLRLIGAINEESKITALGEDMLKLSLPVRFAKMFIEAKKYRLEGDILILYYLYFNHNWKENAKIQEDLKSDWFGSFCALKQLYCQSETDFSAHFPRCERLFKNFSVEPSITDVPAMKRIIASAFPDCLFILTSKTGYKRKSESQFSYTTLASSSVKRGENKYVVGFLSSINRSKLNNFKVKENRGMITLPTAYTLEEVLECFEPFLDISISNENGYIMKKIQYNGLLLTSEVIGTVNENQYVSF